MTEQEIAQALMEMIKEDAKRPPREQLQPLIDAGVIDEQGRVLIGGNFERRGKTGAPSTASRKKPKAKKRRTA